MFLGIDPGVSTGWAVLNATGGLEVCGKGETFPLLSNRSAIIERPQVYRAGKSKGDPNDLITLAIRVGRYQERLEAAGVPVKLYLPTTWKGQIDKSIHHTRVEATLTEREREIVYAVAKRPNTRGYDDNVWDAVALAKWGFTFKAFASLKT